MEKVIEKLPVTSTIRGLGIGETCEFPIEQRSTVYTIVHRFKNDNIRTGWDCKIDTDTTALTVSAKRVR